MDELIQNTSTSIPRVVNGKEWPISMVCGMSCPNVKLTYLYDAWLVDGKIQFKEIRNYS